MFSRLSLFVALTIGSLLTFSSFTPANFFRYDDGDSRRIVINREYSLNIANSLVVDTSLNEEASLQYADIYREVYVIVIDEVKDEFVKAFKDAGDYDPSTSIEKNYSRVQMKSISSKAKMKGKPVSRSLKIDGYEAEIFDFTAKVKGVKPKISYKIGFLTTPDKCYMIMAWTLASSKAKNNSELESMIKSFRLEN